MDFLSLKALHIIFVVTWFAGLFYIVRLFIYHTEAQTKDEPEKSILQKQYKLMEKRLWLIITWPSAILASLFAFLMLYENPSYLEMPWMHVKLSFVFGLYIYHGFCHKIYKNLQQDNINSTSTKLRIFNEIATVILIAVVFLVVLKNAVNWIYGVVGILGVSLLMMFAVKGYKKLRSKKKWEEN